MYIREYIREACILEREKERKQARKKERNQERTVCVCVCVRSERVRARKSVNGVLVLRVVTCAHLSYEERGTLGSGYVIRNYTIFGFKSTNSDGPGLPAGAYCCVPRVLCHCRKTHKCRCAGRRLPGELPGARELVLQIRRLHTVYRYRIPGNGSKHCGYHGGHQ